MCKLSSWAYLKEFKTARDESWRRVNARNKCPKCNHSDWCMYNQDEQKVLCMREESEFPVKKGMGGWVHHMSEESFDFKNSNWSEFREEAKAYAQPHEIASFYEWMLKKFPITEEDYEYIYNRGIKKIDDYGTLVNPNPPYNCIEIPDYFADGIPGVFSSRNLKHKYLNARTEGIFKVVRNVFGQAVGVEIRLRDEERKRTKAKYKPLSSEGKHLGISADARQYGVYPGYKSGVLYVTEGLDKAQITCERLGYTTVGIRSSANWRFLVKDLIDLFSEYHTIVLAFDMDYHSNPHVKTNLTNFIEAIKERLIFNIFLAEWDRNKNGIDDAILAGLQIHINQIFERKDIVNLQTAATNMRKEMQEILDSPDGLIHVFKSTVGAGKTRGLVNIFNEMTASGQWFKNENGDPLRVLWLTDDNKTLLEETEREFDVKPSRLEGRTDNAASAFLCMNYSTVETAGKAHHNIMKSVCKKCDFVDDCDYLKSTNRILRNDNFVLSVKASFFNESERLNEFDLIIIDESMTQDIYKTKTITQMDLDLHLHILNKLIRNTESQTLIEQYEYAVMAIDLLKDCAMMSEKSDEPIVVNAPEGIEEYTYETDPSYKVDGERLFLKVFLKDLGRSSMYAYQGNLYIDVPQQNVVNQLAGKTIINLDATPSKIKLRCFHELVKYHEYNVEEFVNVFQVMNLKGSKRQLIDPDRNDIFLRGIQFIAEKDPIAQTTVLSIKSFIDILNEYKEDKHFEIDVGWYGNHTRGFNKFENTDNLILAGNFCRNLSFMQMQLQTLLSMGIETTLDEIVAEDTLNEMIQAAGRGRAVRRKDKPLNLFLFTNTKISGFNNITEIPSIEALIGDFNPDQQSGNEQKKIEAEEKVVAVVERMIGAGMFAWEIELAKVAQESSVSFDVIRRVLVEVYFRQLFECCEQPDLIEDQLQAIANTLQPPSMAQIKDYSLNLTRLGASVLDYYTLDELQRVNFHDKPFNDYLLTILPVGLNKNKWIKFTSTLADGVNYRTQVELAEASGLTRQSIAKYLVAAQRLAKLYHLNKNHVTDLQSPPEKMVHPVNIWILIEFLLQIASEAENLYSELQFGSEEALSGWIDETITTLHYDEFPEFQKEAYEQALALVLKAFACSTDDP